MKVALFVISLAFLLGSLKKYKNLHNPYTSFNCLWAIVSLFVLIGNPYVFEPSNTALTVVAVGCMAYNLSIFSPRFVIGKKNELTIQEDANMYSFNSRRAVALSIIALILSIVSCVDAVKSLLMGESFAAIRLEYYTYSTTSSVWMYYLRMFVISPIRYVVLISAIISLFKERVFNKILLFNAALIIILQAITSGGRYVLMNAVFMFVCGYFVFRRKNKMQLRRKILLIVFVLLFSYAIVFLTNDRTTALNQDMRTGERLYFTIYEYFSGSITYLGKVTETYPEIVGTTYGLNFFAGFITPFFVGLTFLRLISYPQIFNVIGTYACEVMKIGPETYYNAMPTIFGYFYIDGGLWLTFVEAWLFGYICKRLYSRSDNGNLLYTTYYLMLFTQICNSSTRWFVYSSDFCLAFIYMLFVIRKTKNCRHVHDESY